MFTIQEAHGVDVWKQPFTVLRAPLIFNLRQDPFERADQESIGYDQWWIEHMFVFGPAAGYVGEFLQTFIDYPPRQRPGSFTIDGALESLYAQGANVR